ncbi:hypothetical protein LTR66_011943 [Elasticomyces elasticus]|nr:hypothetical protein LTR66_011943 [Elasticomyces elasticus]
MADLDKGIRVGQEAVDATPLDHPNRAMHLTNLGDQLGLRYERTGMIDGLRTATICFTSALRSTNAPPLLRIAAGRAGSRLSVINNDWEHASVMLRTAVELLPRLVLRSLPRDDQQHRLERLAGLSAEAASAALQVGRTPDDALEILEAGRGIIASLMIDFRSDMSQLERLEPLLFSEYSQLRYRVSLPLLTDIVGNRYEAVGGLNTTIEQSVPGRVLSVPEAISQRSKDVNKLEKMETTIRQSPGFDRFLLPLSSGEVVALADRGPIVSFNATRYRSDAFLITNTCICSLALKELKFDELADNIAKLVGKDKLTTGTLCTKAGRQKQLRRMLTWLWNVAVEPVLAQLGLLMMPKLSERLPRVWWVTSGLMGQMPIHAAGDSPRNTSSYVVSNYVPTLKALAYSRKKRFLPLFEAERKMLIVEMPQMTGLSDLSTTQECALELEDEQTQVEKMLKLLGSFIFQTVGDRPFSSALINSLAVLGIDKEMNRLRTADDSSYMLAGVVYCTNVIAAEVLLPSADREKQDNAERKRFLGERRGFLADGSYSPMSTMVSLLAYGKSIALNTGNSASTQWSRDMRVLRLYGRPIVLKRFKEVIHDAVAEAERVLWEDGMHTALGERFVIPLDDIEDDVTFTKRGYSFVSRPSSGLSAGLDWMVGKLAKSVEGQRLRVNRRWQPRAVR